MTTFIYTSLIARSVFFAYLAVLLASIFKRCEPVAVSRRFGEGLPDYVAHILDGLLVANFGQLRYCVTSQQRLAQLRAVAVIIIGNTEV